MWSSLVYTQIHSHAPKMHHVVTQGALTTNACLSLFWRKGGQSRGIDGVLWEELILWYKKSSIKIFYKCCITSIKTVLFFLWSWKNWCEFIQRNYCGKICRNIVRKGPGLEGSSETNGMHTSSQGMGDREGRWLERADILLWYRKNIPLKRLPTVTSYICCLFLSSSTDLALITV